MLKKALYTNINLIKVSQRSLCGREVTWKNKTVMVSGCGGQVGRALLKSLSSELGAS